MDPTRIAFESRPNVLLPKKNIYGVRVNEALHHFWLSRRAHNGDFTTPPSTYKFGDMANQLGLQTMSLLAMPSLNRVLRTRVNAMAAASNKEINYIISLSPPQTLGCQVFHNFDMISEYIISEVLKSLRLFEGLPVSRSIC
jgi:hypothetical protein